MKNNLPFFLATRELRNDWLASLCFIAALVGVLAPLLIILALKNGVIGSMVERLIEDPANRELIAVGAGNHDAAFFKEFRARSDVAFIIPATRSINTSADAVQNRKGRKVKRSVPLIPSASGDPLIDGDIAVAPGQVLISQTLANGLDVSSGDTVEIMIGRNIDGHSEMARSSMLIIGIVPKIRYGRAAMFVSLPDLLAAERFRDDATIEPGHWRENRQEPESYASFRLYAATLQDIEVLQQDLQALSVRVRPRAENATLLLKFRQNLNVLYLAVAMLAVFGFWAAMAANLRGMVERQRVGFSLLDLIGLPKKSRCMIPIWQSLILVLLGILLTILIVWPIIAIINTFFQTEDGQFIARLGLVDFVGTFMLGLATALTASIWAASAVREISPDEVLRHA